MSNDFDFGQVGRRMPYTTPEGFFDQMQEQVMSQVSAEPPMHRSRLRVTLRTILATAAAIALLVVVSIRSQTPRPVTTHDVEQAFDNLSAADQAYLQSVYQADVFIDE